MVLDEENLTAVAFDSELIGSFGTIQVGFGSISRGLQMYQAECTEKKSVYHYILYQNNI